MKKLIIVVLFVGLLSACDSGFEGKETQLKVGFWIKGDKLSGHILKDSDGKVYVLKHHIGDSYFISELDTTVLKTVLDLSRQ